MAFPVSPTEGQTFTENNTVWIYSAVTDQWNRSVINPLNETTYIGSDGAPGGIGGATQVIFNDNGSLASDAGLVYNKTTDALSAGGFIPTSSTVPANGIYLPAANSVAVATNGTGRLFISATGNIGVGTASPENFAGFTTQTINGSSGSVLAFQDGGTAGTARLVKTNTIFSVETIAAIPLVFHTNTAERLRITAAGLVGIGTSIPGQLLEIAATSNPQMRFTDTGDYYYDIGITSSNKFSISPAGSPALTVVAGGDVGIGTTSPGNTLQVDADSEYNIFGIQRKTSPTATFSLGINSAQTQTNINYQTDGLAFTRLGSEAMRLDGSRRLLIGTSSDSGGALFQVNGDRIRVGTAKTPATSGATGTTGEIAWDADYIYVCTATNTWKRSAIATW
jgi:hypothetical protein